MTFPFPPVCKDCARREVGCHGSCAEFRAAREEYEARTGKAAEARRKEDDAVTFSVESIRRTKRRKRDRRERK